MILSSVKQQIISEEQKKKERGLSSRFIAQNFNDTIAKYFYKENKITLIEKEVYMSPSSYLIARNINIIFDSIYFAKKSIEDWYKKIENNKNERVVNIHNNINLDHYIKNDKPYLISWNKSKKDMPIYDIIKIEHI